jgi:N4-gp56 family major capsid protein
VSENPEQVVNVKLDTSELQKMLAEHMAELKEMLKPKQEPVKTTVSESANEKAKEFEAWLRGTREAVSGVPSGPFTYQKDLLVVLPKIGVGLRDYADVVIIPRGSSEARWYKIDVPAFSALTSKVAPPESAQTITTVSATLSERGALQVIGYDEIERSAVDLVRGIEETLTLAAAIDIDKVILNELDTNTNTYFANNRTAESAITSTDTLKLSDLVAAKRRLTELSKRVPRPGELVLVCSTKQYHDLLHDSGVMKAADFGGGEPVRTGVLPQVLGINIIQTDNVSTGTGSGGTTTYRAHLFFPKAFGLAISRDLMIEAFREPPKRAISLTASYVAGAKLIEPNYSLKVITA